MERKKILAQELLADEQVFEVVKAMYACYPQSETELHHNSPFQLLCATVLSAQATDAGVNKATPALFAEYPTPEAMMEASVEDIQKKIKTIGLYKNKSKFLKNLSRQIVTEFNGEVPRTREELMTLSGVGRKTANVVLTNAFDIPAFAVDTHVNRMSKNFLFVKEDASIDQVEEEMTQKLPSEWWYQAHHSILLFGRYQCVARRHDHGECLLRIQDHLSEQVDSKEIMSKLSTVESKYFK